MAMTLETLPGEVFLQIISHLDPADVVRLQAVSRKLLRTGRDNSLWRPRCFADSNYLDTLLRRRMLFGRANGGSDTVVDEDVRHDSRIMANWDPVFPREAISWYDEYIQRNAPIAMNWFQRPAVEARGVALYRPDGSDHTELLAVAPLDDGSVCLWDVNGTRGRRGAILAQSPAGLLFPPTTTTEAKPEFGVTECVSVDSQRHRAFFAIQNRLVEVDLRQLVVAGATEFPWPITALSEAHANLPLSVGMHQGLHLHDTRTRTSPIDAGPHPAPGPISILHLQRPGAEADLSDDIYTAGRVPIILHYDRRNLSAVQDTMYSGASLCSMTSLPYPYSTLDAELRRDGLLSLGQVERSKSVPGGRTLVACGEYKSKGSLELYGIGLAPAWSGRQQETQYRENATLKNRQNSSFSKILSVATHGTRLMFSDGAGQIKWFERDGITEVRTCQISGEDDEGAPSLFGTTHDAGDIARKLLPTWSARTGPHRGSTDNDVLFWTGDRLGLVGFSSQPGCKAEDFVEAAKTAQERAVEVQERVYHTKMRQLLEKQANDVRFVRHLGFGSGHRGR